MTRPQDRCRILFLVDEAVTAGARSWRCCEVLGLSNRTLGRWRTDPGGTDARTTTLRPRPANALSQQEREAIVLLCNTPENKDKPPAQIVPEMADRGIYIASESSFYRTLRENKQLNHRGRARAPRQMEKPIHRANGPNQVWVWDITYLRTNIAGIFLHLYVIMDLYSRKIVAAEVWAEENAEHSKTLLQRAGLSENIAAGPPLVLHGDNGSPLKAGTVLALMHFLGITPSHSRPRVSNDNPHAEALMRTAKYHPSLPPEGFPNLQSARQWADLFVRGYNQHHRHSALKFVTPNEKHARNDVEILRKRHDLYQHAKSQKPRRWIRGKTRNWEPVQVTSLNPIDERILERNIKKSA